jgi:hypothetical protein
MGEKEAPDDDDDVMLSLRCGLVSTAKGGRGVGGASAGNVKGKPAARSSCEREELKDISVVGIEKGA